MKSFNVSSLTVCPPRKPLNHAFRQRVPALLAAISLVIASANAAATCTGRNTATVNCSGTDTGPITSITTVSSVTTAGPWQISSGYYFLQATGVSASTVFGGNAITVTDGTGISRGVLHSSATGNGGNATLTLQDSNLQRLTGSDGHGAAASAQNATGNADLTSTRNTISIAAAAGTGIGLVARAYGSGTAIITATDTNVTTAANGAGLLAMSATGNVEIHTTNGTIDTYSHGLYGTTGGAGTVNITNTGAAVSTSGNSSYAINAVSASGQIIVDNSGHLSPSGSAVRGISATSTSGPVEVTNPGAIDIVGTGTTNAIRAQGNGVTINSSGNITQSGPSGGASASLFAYAAAGGNASITASGNITTNVHHGIEAFAPAAGTTASVHYQDGSITVNNPDPAIGIAVWNGGTNNPGIGEIIVGPNALIDVARSVGLQARQESSNLVTVAAGSEIRGGNGAINLMSSGGSAGATQQNTVNNNGTMGARNDVLIASTDTQAGSTTTLTNSATAQMTGYMLMGPGANTVNNTGLWALRNFNDTNFDNVREVKGIAISSHGPSGNNSVTNTGTLSLPAVTSATSLNTAGQYLPLGLTANAITLTGPVQGNILNNKTFTNTGTIDMQASNVPGDVLVISGGGAAGSNGGGVYITGGTLKLDTVANAGNTASQSDVLVVDSTQIGGGPTALNINMTGTGAQTTGDGILVVEVLGTSVANAFSLASPITVGGFTYQLYQGGVGGSHPNNWYLRSTQQQLTITKTTPATTLTPGGSVTYTVTVTNSGASAASNVAVSDPLPTGVTAFNWACAATGGATCPNASGSGAISETVTSLPAGASVVYMVTATVSGTPPASVVNTATASVPGGVCLPGNTPVPCTASAPVPPAPVVQVTKTANVVQAAPGGTVGYTLTVSNTSASPASNVVVSDPIAPGLSAYTWTCTAAGGATCPNANGSGALNETVVLLPGNAALTYLITATVSAQPPASITNVATATVPGGLCVPGNTPSPCTTSVTTPTLLNIPVPGPGGALLALLAMVLAHFGAQRMRKSC